VHAMISPHSRPPGLTNLSAESCLTPGRARRARTTTGKPAGQGKGPGQRLRTGVQPVGRELSLRCLLGARALSTPNPVQPDEPVGPANEPVAGLCSNIPPMAVMSTTGFTTLQGFRAGAVWSIRCHLSLLSRSGTHNCRATAKICEPLPLAGRGFGVWITPLGCRDLTALFPAADAALPLRR
jgi:hypothetical protein